MPPPRRAVRADPSRPHMQRGGPVRGWLGARAVRLSEGLATHTRTPEAQAPHLGPVELRSRSLSPTQTLSPTHHGFGDLITPPSRRIRRLTCGRAPCGTHAHSTSPPCDETCGRLARYPTTNGARPGRAASSLAAPRASRARAETTTSSRRSRAPCSSGRGKSAASRRARSRRA
eukprot:5159891-Prymnesium_polylepis.1